MPQPRRSKIVQLSATKMAAPLIHMQMSGSKRAVGLQLTRLAIPIPAGADRVVISRHFPVRLRPLPRESHQHQYLPPSSARRAALSA